MPLVPWMNWIIKKVYNREDHFYMVVLAIYKLAQLEIVKNIIGKFTWSTQNGALDEEPNVSIWNGYVEFSAAW